MTDLSHFTENGIEMESGEKVEADIIVTATGLELQVPAASSSPSTASRSPSRTRSATKA